MPIPLPTAILLALIQGLTEFLPVSSSGHLVLAEALLGLRGGQAGGVLFEVAVHAGTLGAVIVVYRRKIGAICSGLAGKVEEARRGAMGYVGLIVLGSVPAGLVGVFLHDRVTGLFDEPAVAAALLAATGLFLLFSRNRRGSRPIGPREAVLIGIAQAAAILPGLSRSGLTITTALLLGAGHAEAAEFSFLLSVPAILGALLLETAGGAGPAGPGALATLAIAAAAAFLSGWGALRLLIGLLRRDRMHRFAWYLLPASAAALAWLGLGN
ncbi:MAG: undecaprenyl-diphosphate phosphatase [Candidatus Krumholzibacteriota bacterium]|nr:undecaprenyl-diphosphate phosphatase [Candidatus Krumholzibacteriota bacterium]